MSRHLHPEARAEIIRANASKRIEETRPKPDAFTGYLVMLFASTGARHGRDVKTYNEAVVLRDQEMRSGDYFKAWIFQKPLIKKQLIDRGEGARESPPGDL